MENLEYKIKLKNMNMDTSKVNENNPLLYVLSRRTDDWNTIGEVERSGHTQKIKQYKSYPMIGFEESNGGEIINKYRDLRDLTDVTTAVLSNLGEQLDKSKEIMFVLHGRDLLNGKVIMCKDYNNKQNKEIETTIDAIIPYTGNVKGDFDDKRNYFISRVLPEMKTNKKITIWSFQHEESRIYHALNPNEMEDNVYQRLLSATSED